MDLGLSGNVVLVTGASRGLGRAVAACVAEEGANVAVASRNEDRVREAAATIRNATGARVAPFVGDVSKQEDVERVVSGVVSEFGRLDGLVCNAGGPPPGDFLELDDGQWEQSFDLTLMSVVRLVRAALPHLERAGGGRIVNIASSSVKEPIPGLLLSGVYRAGLVGLFKHLSSELASRHILLNTVSPGRFDTERVRSLDANKAEQAGKTLHAVRQEMESKIPWGRYGDPVEFGRVVTFLLSAANTYVTGQSILVDGGMVRAL